MEEATKKRLEDEYNDSLERFKAEYLELCYEVGQITEDLINKEKRIKVLEALIKFYSELEKGKNDK